MTGGRGLAQDHRCLKPGPLCTGFSGEVRVTAASPTLQRERPGLIRKEELLSCVTPISLGSVGNLPTCSPWLRTWLRVGLSVSTGARRRGPGVSFVMAGQDGIPVPCMQPLLILLRKVASVLRVTALHSMGPLARPHWTSVSLLHNGSPFSLGGGQDRSVPTFQLQIS